MSTITDLKKVKDNLPNKASDLILVALADLEKVEKDKKYLVNMNHFHHFTNEGRNSKCFVCFAGSVMAKTCGLDFGVDINWNIDGFNKKLVQKFSALDNFRVGRMRMGLKCLGFKNQFITNIDEDEFTSYHDNPKLFKKTMRKMAAFLKKNGY